MVSASTCACAPVSPDEDSCVVIGHRKSPIVLCFENISEWNGLGIHERNVTAIGNSSLITCALSWLGQLGFDVDKDTVANVHAEASKATDRPSQTADLVACFS
jgi:hypothetical protein